MPTTTPHQHSTRSYVAWFAATGLAAGIALAIVSIPQLTASMRLRTGLDALYMTPTWMIACALTVCFGGIVLASRQRTFDAVAVAGAVTAFHAAPALAWATPRGYTTYLHAGFVSLIEQGIRDPAIDIRMNWFSGLAWMGDLARALNLTTLELARYWPIAIQAAVAGGIWMLASTLGADRRTAATAAWLGALLSFVGQDYMSPQSIALIVYLGYLAIVLTIAITGRRSTITAGPLILLAIACGVGIASTHLLTSAVLAVTVAGVLAATGTFRELYYLPALQGFLTLSSYLTALDPNGQADTARGDLFNLDVLARGNVAGRVERSQGDPLRTLVIADRLILAVVCTVAAVAVLAFARRRIKHRGTLFALIAASVPVTVAIPYGGESLMRAFLFASPIAAIIWATLLTSGPWLRRTLPVIGLTLAALLIPARWGNEDFERFSQAQIDAVAYALDITTTGDRVVGVDFALPWRDQLVLDREWQMPSVEQYYDAGKLYGLLTNGKTGTGVLINSTQAALSRRYSRGLDRGIEVASGDVAISQLMRSDPRFVLLAEYDNGVEVWFATAADAPIPPPPATSTPTGTAATPAAATTTTVKGQP